MNPRIVCAANYCMNTGYTFLGIRHYDVNMHKPDERYLKVMLTKIWDFFFHRHHWEIHDEADLVSYNVGRRSFRGKLYVLKCSKCGEIKSKKVVCSYVQIILRRNK